MNFLGQAEFGTKYKGTVLLWLWFYSFKLQLSSKSM